MMRGFFCALGFLLAMQFVGAALISIGLYGIPALNVAPDMQRAILGFWCIGTVIATGLIMRFVLRRIERSS